MAYAGVPVSDLVARMGYQPAGYQALYSAPYHIGKTVREDIKEYRRRSPVYHAKELQTPLLIHTNTNDEDVNVLEVEHLIEALKAEGKKFEYKIYQDAPGGHYFNRIDTKLGEGIAAGDLAISGRVFEAGPRGQIGGSASTLEVRDAKGWPRRPALRS